MSSFNPFGPGNDPRQSPPPGPMPGGSPNSGGRPGNPGAYQQPVPPPQHGQSGPGDRRQWSPPAAGQPQSPGRHEVGGQFGAGAGQYGPAATGFNDPQVPAVASSITMSAPPNGLLIVAAACAGAGGLIGALGWGRWWSLLGWLLAGPIAIWLVARFVAVDTERKTATVYSRPGSTGVLWAVAIVLTVLGIAVTALAVGFWIGRL